MCALGVVISMALPAAAHTVDEILSRMMARKEWQDRALLEYRAQRKFYAKNMRFNAESTMHAETIFRRPDQLQSTIRSHEGSSLIRSRVFEKILEAETSAKKERQQVDITPQNYDFTLAGAEQCGDRTCFRLNISPKQRSKYALDGEIWVDGEDYSIVRIRGTPAKKPSFWTQKTEIDRTYKKIEGMWLPDRLDSSSDIRIAGHSVLSIEYTYQSVISSVEE
jgi:hypothetical protein